MDAGSARGRISLWFDRQGEDAARHYTSVLRDGQIGRVTRYLDPDPTPANRPGEVMCVEFSVEGIDFLALNGGPAFQMNEAISIMLYRDTQEELDATWEALLEGGGQPMQCGWLKDRFGVTWQVTPRVLDELVASEDPAVARAATDAMLEMVKLDIQQIVAAADAARTTTGATSG